MHESSRERFKNGCTEITGIGGGGATPTATTGRKVAKAAIDGPKNRARASKGQVIWPHSAKRDGVMDMGVGHRLGAEVPRPFARCVQLILKKVNAPLPGPVFALYTGGLAWRTAVSVSARPSI